MILILIAAPLIALARPPRFEHSSHLWPATLCFGVALWFWHMPVPYAATFWSDWIYWAMHATLFGSAIWLWSTLLAHPPRRAASALASGTMTSIQMGLLGAILTLSGHALFVPHYFTAAAWGLTPLGDQELGGALMWVPGCVLFLAAGLRSISLLWRRLEPARL
jgi:putative membrane protein